jgi:hypothetical protein
MNTCDTSHRHVARHSHHAPPTPSPPHNARRLAQQLMPAAAPHVVKQATRSRQGPTLQAAVAQTATYYSSPRAGQDSSSSAATTAIPAILGYTESAFDDSPLPPHCSAGSTIRPTASKTRKPRKNISIHSRAARPKPATCPHFAAPATGRHPHRADPLHHRRPTATSATRLELHERSITGMRSHAGAQVAYFFTKTCPSHTGARPYSTRRTCHVQPARRHTHEVTTSAQQLQRSVPANTARLGNYMYSWARHLAHLRRRRRRHIRLHRKPRQHLQHLLQPHTPPPTSRGQLADHLGRHDFRDLAAAVPSFSGYKASENSGHAVLVDGYRAATTSGTSTSAGRQGDGWYTRQRQTSMNGFNEYQNITYNVRRESPNQASASFPEGIYRNHTTPVSSRQQQRHPRLLRLTSSSLHADQATNLSDAKRAATPSHRRAKRRHRHAVDLDSAP